jgi:ubiquinone/menaquinone biosynthesis C-methylase UbiE
MVLWHGMGNFAGTAEYYDQYRPGVTQEVIDILMAAVPQPTHLLDLGCGTGRILAQFVPLFTDTVAVEPDHDMLKLARRRMQGLPVTFVQDTAETAVLPTNWQASLVTICRAFHWMDRPAVLKRLEEVVLPHGTIALVSDHSFWHLPDAWSEIIQHTLKEFLGPERQTAIGTYRPPAEFFQENLQHSAFSAVTEHIVPVERQWTLDEVIGYLYSTSFASKVVLGERTEAFEKQLRERLLEYAPNGIFTEHNRFEVILAKRPD